MARRIGSLIFVAGMVGRAPDGSPVDGGVRAQSARALERIDEAIAGAAEGASIGRLRIYLVRIGDWPDVRSVLEEHFDGVVPPAVVIGGVDLVEDWMLVEIEADVAVG